MAENDGGFVFPSGHYNSETGHEDWPIRNGMTRRQLYAGMGMMADLATGVAMETDEQRAGNARFYWRMADALLATEEEEE